jgi:hypothetical protein
MTYNTTNATKTAGALVEFHEEIEEPGINFTLERLVVVTKVTMQFQLTAEVTEFLPLFALKKRSGVPSKASLYSSILVDTGNPILI